MATKRVVELVDDLTGEPAVETARFGLDGVSYEVDLSEVNASRLREDLGAWVAAARRVGGAPARRSNGAKRGRKSELAGVREWAAANGIALAARGRIPAAVLEQYERSR